MTKIEWVRNADGSLGVTWNPTRGCRRVSPGCENCYAERQAIRHAGAMTARGVPGSYHGLVKLTGKGPRWTGEGRLVPEVLAQPLRWRKPRTVFVDSMSDLFFEAFTFEEIAAVFGVMAATPQHTFQVLTKRPKRALEWFRWIKNRTHPRATTCACLHLAQQRIDDDRLRRSEGLPFWTWPLPNVWLGVSVEDQQRADERIPLLLQCPAAVRFVSYEPALGPVDFNAMSRTPGASSDVITEEDDAMGPPLGGVGGIGWVIVGGESGHGARPFALEWARSVVQQCKAADVPVFVKQLGRAPFLQRLPEWHENGGGSWSADVVMSDGRFNIKLKDRKGGDMDEWPPDLRVREMPRQRALEVSNG